MNCCELRWYITSASTSETTTIETAAKGSGYSIQCEYSSRKRIYSKCHIVKHKTFDYILFIYIKNKEEEGKDRNENEGANWMKKDDEKANPMNNVPQKYVWKR